MEFPPPLCYNVGSLTASPPEKALLIRAAWPDYREGNLRTAPAMVAVPPRPRIRAQAQTRQRVSRLETSRVRCPRDHLHIAREGRRVVRRVRPHCLSPIGAQTLQGA